MRVLFNPLTAQIEILPDEQEGQGSVTSVGGSGTVNGITLSGTVTTSGNLTLGGTLDLSSPPAIGGTAPAAGSFTTLKAGSLTGVLKASTGTVAAAATVTTLTATGAITLNTTTNAQSYTTTGAGTITISSGTTGSINNMTLGATTPSTVAGTTGTFSGVVTDAGSFGGIYIYDGATAQTIATGTTPTKITQFSASAGADGQANDTTPDHANSKITLTRAGKYLINYSVSYISDTNGVTWESYAFAGGSVVNATGGKQYIATGSQTSHIRSMGFVNVSANTDIDLRIYHDRGGNVALTIGHANLTVLRVGN